MIRLPQTGRRRVLAGICLLALAPVILGLLLAGSASVAIVLIIAAAVWVLSASWMFRGLGGGRG